jgi:hypothetical protein
MDILVCNAKIFSLKIPLSFKGLRVGASYLNAATSSDDTSAAAFL